MAFDWTDFITCAKDLSSKSDEASLRSSISRAYYGVFGNVKNYCVIKHNIRGSGESVHQQIILALKQSNVSLEFSLGNTLHQLRTSRNEADYEAKAKITPVLVELTIKKAQGAIEVLKLLNK